MSFWNFTHLLFLGKEPELLNESSSLFTPGLSTDDYGATFAKMFLSLIALILLLWVSFWFLRRLIRHRFHRGADTQAIHILEKQVMSPKSMLYLLEVDGKKILLTESQLEVRQVHLEIEAPSSLPVSAPLPESEK